MNPKDIENPIGEDDFRHQLKMDKLIEDMELLGGFLADATEWWESISGEDKLIRLIAYETAYGNKIEFPDENQLMVLYYLELHRKTE